MIRAALQTVLTLALGAALGCGFCSAQAAERSTSAPSRLIAGGRSIYQLGALTSGEALEGRRTAGMTTTGAAVACINCHRRSGLGSKEGLSYIPPIAGPYLFHPRVKSVEDFDLPYVEGLRPGRDPYTDETLARAIRSGIDADGKRLDYLMPRYDLGDADMAALIAYLKSLDMRQMPGVTDTELHFATIITPDSDPVARRGMLDVLDSFFAERNAVQRYRSPRLRSDRSAMMMFRAVRRWQLHVWELEGPPSTWEAQLNRHLAEQPVFAVLSGIGGREWRPVHDFCEHRTVPCLFPNVEVPVSGGRDYYSLYFSGGVLLEAGLMAQEIAGADGARAPKIVEQVYRAGDSGEAAAKALAAALRAHGVAVQAHAVAASATPLSLEQSVRSTSKADVLVLWLRPTDVRVLGEVPAPSSRVFMSGLLAGLEGAPLPPGWRERTRLTYPFDLPDRRIVRVDYPLGWFRIRRIPVVAEQVQVDTYLACGLLSEVLSHMVDTFNRDYLIERLQEMVEHRILTGYYPRLTLGTGQPFASKGGYLVRFAAPMGPKIVAEGGWLVPSNL